MGTLKSPKSAIRTILSATFVAGTLDILAAILVYSIIMDQTSPSRILMAIASGIFGKAAYSGGTTMVLTGLFLHYIIALIFSTFYYFIFPYIAFLRRQRLFSGILYGIFVWLVMNFGVLRIVFTGISLPDPQAALVGMIIVIVAVGLPISYIVSANRD